MGWGGSKSEGSDLKTCCSKAAKRQMVVILRLKGWQEQRDEGKFENCQWKEKYGLDHWTGMVEETKDLDLGEGELDVRCMLISFQEAKGQNEESLLDRRK